jgi:hypothetical protein
MWEGKHKPEREIGVGWELSHVRRKTMGVSSYVNHVMMTHRRGQVANVHRGVHSLLAAVRLLPLLVVPRPCKNEGAWFVSRESRAILAQAQGHSICHDVET